MRMRAERYAAPPRVPALFAFFAAFLCVLCVTLKALLQPDATAKGKPFTQSTQRNAKFAEELRWVTGPSSYCPRIGVPSSVIECAMRSFHSAGPVMWTLVPFASTATVTGISTTSNS